MSVFGRDVQSGLNADRPSAEVYHCRFEGCDRQFYSKEARSGHYVEHADGDDEDGEQSTLAGFGGGAGE